MTQHNYLSIIVNSDWDLETEAKAIQDLSRRQIDGIIFVESRLSSSDHAPELEGVEQMVGLFINTLPVRLTFEPGQTVLGVLRKLRDDQLTR